jgi:hypothetical protein
LEAEEQMRRDERFELELRAHVGELVGDDAASAFKAVDDSIGQLVTEKHGLQSRIDELVAMLEQRDTPPLPRASGETVRRDVLAAAIADVRAGGAAVPTPVPAHAPATAQAPASTQGPASATHAPASAHAPAPAPAPAPAQTAPPSEQQPKAQPKGADSSFDELAFLNTVVGQDDNSGSLIAQSRRDAALVRDERAAESLLAGLANQPANGGAEKPLAANVTGNVPITLRAGTTEQPKTLKCNECGGMNYPTEWYCERCGAELAAL